MAHDILNLALMIVKQQTICEFWSVFHYTVFCVSVFHNRCDLISVECHNFSQVAHSITVFCDNWLLKLL